MHMGAATFMITEAVRFAAISVQIRESGLVARDTRHISMVSCCSTRVLASCV